MRRLSRGLGFTVSAFVLACGFPRPVEVEGDAGPAATFDAGVDPGSACTRTTCIDDLLSMCGTSGTVEQIETCRLGCYSDQSRCNGLLPSNGLRQSLEDSDQRSAMMLPAGTVVDTDMGSVTAAGTSVAVSTTTVAQPGGSLLRVFMAKSWAISDIRIQGGLPVAFVASDGINVLGVIDASANSVSPGPGAPICGDDTGRGGAAGAHFVRTREPGYPPLLFVSNGHGGGGFGTAGGAGGVEGDTPIGLGGLSNGTPELVPLRGGCQGGGDTGVPDTGLHRGAGGGAIQLVAGGAIHLVGGALSGRGVVHVGGGGSPTGSLGRTSDTDTAPIWGPGGAGSGGAILIEAPSVILDDGTALFAGGGGGGGFGACSPKPDGHDASPDETAAAGGACSVTDAFTVAGGSGATTATGGAGHDGTGGGAGGGGGGLGRIRINTADGRYVAGSSALIRGVMTTGVAGRR
jgi:hypothetical protein